jgi:tetratricopeptide (TPR) repeat protein
LVLDPRNLELLNGAAYTYVKLRQFPAALKLYNRMLDITPNDPEVLAAKSAIYQTQGNLEEATKCLSGINCETASALVFTINCDRLKLQRNHTELIRLLKSRIKHIESGTIDHFFDSSMEKALLEVWMALAQRLAGDTAGAKVSGDSARKALERLCKEQPDDSGRAFYLIEMSNAYAAMGQKESALKTAEQGKLFGAYANDADTGPQFDENLALVQAMCGENSRAIANLAKLLHTPYKPYVYTFAPVTPAVLRLDPFWDSLRSDPAFQKLCEEKADVTAHGH